MTIKYCFDDIYHEISCYGDNAKCGYGDLEYEYEFKPTKDDLISFYGTDDVEEDDYDNDDEFAEFLRDVYEEKAHDECVYMYGECPR